MRSHLSSGRINVDLVREDARRRLLEYLDKCSGTKTIIWDQTLLGPFGLIAEFLLFKEHGVTRIFYLRKGNFQKTDSQNVIFLVRPKLALMDMIADYVLADEESKGSKKEFHILFVSRKSFLCEKHLEERGVYGNFASVESYEVDLFPVDCDVLSMELDETFKECHLENDVTRMFHIAKALVTLQYMYGVIPNVYGKGKCAKLVFDLMTRIRREKSGNEPQITAQIHNMILLDRSIDLLTPLSTQLTYEGLIDEIFGIRNNIVKVPPEKFTKTDEGGGIQDIPTQPTEILLNSAESLYADLRDKNFNAIGPTLSKKTKILSSQYEERHDAKSPRDLKEFVDKLPYMQMAKKSLGIHTSVAELIKERIDNDSFRDTLQLEQEFMNGLDTDKVNPYIEDCISRQENVVKVLRLICMQSVVNGGLKQKVIDYYKREILQTYGFHHILSLNNLEKAKLLKLSGNKYYSVMKKTLKLIVEDVNEQNPVDISYVHSGYAPLSVRLVQFLTNPGWRAITEVLNMLPGPTVEEKQIIPIGLRKRRGSGSSTQSGSEEQKVTLVVFLGGCTFAEISALRFLSHQDDAPVDYIVATTSIINGNTFVSSLFEPSSQAKGPTQNNHVNYAN